MKAKTVAKIYSGYSVLQRDTYKLQFPLLGCFRVDVPSKLKTKHTARVERNSIGLKMKN